MPTLLTNSLTISLGYLATHHLVYDIQRVPLQATHYLTLTRLYFLAFHPFLSDGDRHWIISLLQSISHSKSK